MKATISPADRDTSQVYMVKDGSCDIEIKGGESLLDPVYCLACPQTKDDQQFNMVQAAEHVEYVHQQNGHQVFVHGLRRLKGNGGAYKEYVASQNKKKQERAEKKESKKRASA